MIDTYPTADPGIYPKDSDIIPYSPRTQFKFMPSDQQSNMTISIDSMRNMSTDEIVELYRKGYRLDSGPIQTQLSPNINTAANDITVSTDALVLIGIGILAYMFFVKKW